MAKAKSSERYQTLVIGGGLTGLVIAQQLSARGEMVALIEELDRLGGDARPHLSKFGPLDQGLKFIPANESAQQALNFLKGMILDLTWEQIDLPPVSFDGGQFKPFVGFGAKNLEATDEIHHYTSTQRLQPNLPVHEWTQRLQTGFRGDLYLKSLVTAFEHEGNSVTGVQINGKETIQADRIVFCGQPKELLKYAFASSIAARTRQKLSKAEFSSAIYLELFHAQAVTDSQAMHVLWSPSEEGSPCLGQFLPPQLGQEPTFQHSQWMTFVPHELSEDSELTGAAVRKIKKQVKRAYPGAFDKLHGEVILVALGSHGHVDLKAEGEQLLTPFQNLYWACPQFETKNPVVGALLQAETILHHWPTSAFSCSTGGPVLPPTARVF